MLVLWEPGVRARAPSAIPRLVLMVNSIRVECPAALMAELADGAASREQWAAGCTGR
jgi:hypothetical protein